MNNYKKGFVIPLVIAIIALLGIGGGTYVYVNKKNADKVENMRGIDWNKIENNKNKGATTTLPSVTITSPNGGETWISGQSQTIKWKSSALSDLEQSGKKYPVVLSVGLIYQDVSIEKPDEYGGGRLCILAHSINPSLGSFVFTPTIGNCPNLNSSRPIIKSGNYKVVIYAGYKNYDGADITSDESDNNFYITSTSSPYINSVFPAPESIYHRISGERLSGSKVYFDGQLVQSNYVSDSMINFIIPGPEVNGSYPIYVENSISKSNTIYFEIKNSLNTKETASGIIKSAYSKSGKNYLDIDYVTMNPSWRPGGESGSPYTNDNNKIRTFEISPEVIITLSDVSSAPINLESFVRLFSSPIDEVAGVPHYDYKIYNPWEITVRNGIITHIAERYLP